MQKPTKKTMSAASLISKLEVNVREANNYDLPAMAEQIVMAGRILKPLIVEETDEGPIVLSGNRRARAAQELLADQQKITAILLQIAETERDGEKRDAMKKSVAETTASIVDALTKVDTYVYRNLTEEERLMLIMDHGSEKPISRTEVVNCCWRMDRQFFSEGDIIRLTYFALAKFTGNERKLSEVPSESKAREAFLRKWLHGTVGNYILSAHRMGDYVREQFLLTMRSDDGLLKEGEKVEMRCSRDRITQLSAAKTKDKDVWTSEGGGPEFNALVEKFKAEDAGDVAKDVRKRPTVKDLTDKADVFKSAAIKKALWIAAGETGGKVAGLLEDDDRMYRDEQAMKLLAESWEKLPTSVERFDLKEFVKMVLHSQVTKLRDYLAELTS